jgi:uncharacterized protein involved in exopolysaccharide biosynthesis
MTDPGTQHLSDYLAILRRRKKQMLIPMAVILLASIALAFLLPPVYQSMATILIEETLIPEQYVASSAEGYADQRIQVITKRLMTSSNLQRIVEKLNLYPEKRQRGEEPEIIADLRDGIQVQTLSGTLTDPSSGKSHAATIAFTVAFNADTPEVAQKVTEELANIYLDENRRIRTRKAETTFSFLIAEERRLAKRVLDLEAQLAAYKEKNAGQLPELMGLTRQLMERTERELEDVERHIYTLEERKAYLEAQLGQLDPYTGQSPAARLRELQTQYLNAAAVYEPNHPDVINLRRQIELLKKEVGVIDEKETIGQELKRVRAELKTSRERYGEDHPDVIRLKKKLSILEAAFDKAVTSRQLGFSLKPDNPAYISIQTQLEAVELNLKQAREQRLRAREKLAEYENKMTQMPRVEQEGLALKRAYETAVKEHQEIRDKLTKADLAVELESGESGQRYSLLEPPYLPKAPSKPNRRAILLLGIVLSLGGGIGYAGLAEYMDRTVRGSKSLSAIVGAPPLAVIPYIAIQKESRARRRKVA